MNYITMRTFIVLFQKEFLQIKRNSFLPKLIVAFPILVMLLMPLIMTMDVKNVNISIVDMDRSSVSRRIMSHIEASDYFTLKQETTEYYFAMESLTKGDKTPSRKKIKPHNVREGRVESDGSLQLSFFQLEDPLLSSLKEDLDAVDLNNMTPLQAFDVLRNMKDKMGLN